jgi:hypothetical protein
VGQGAQQHAANDAEDGGVGADTEAEGEHHGEGEPASAGEAAYGVAKVRDEQGRVRPGAGVTGWPLPLLSNHSLRNRHPTLVAGSRYK